jgi:arsenic resistance protein ArsH
MTAATTLEDYSTSCKPQDSMPSNHSTSSTDGDLNNTASMRVVLKPQRHPDFAFRSLAIPASIDDSTLRSRYRPFLLPNETQHDDWVSRLELAVVTEMAYNDFKITGERIKVLVLYGSLRQR